MRTAMRILLYASIVTLLGVNVAQAQWVFVARKGLQVIQSITSRMEGTMPSQSRGADAATILLEATADKVYATAVKLLHDNPDIEVLWQDDAKRMIGFSKGDQSASMKVTSLSDNLSQILVASTTGTSGGTILVVDGILRVCQRMGVVCSHAQE